MCKMTKCKNDKDAQDKNAQDDKIQADENATIFRSGIPILTSDYSDL